MKIAVATCLLLSVLFVIHTDSHRLEASENLQKDLQRTKRDWSWEDLKNKASEIGGKISDFGGKVVEVTKETGSKLVNATKDAYENREEIYENAKESVKTFGGKVANFTKDTYENRGEIYDNAKDSVTNFGGKVANFTKDTYEKIND